MDRLNELMNSFQRSIKKQIVVVEKINEIIEFFENTIKKEFEIGSLTKSNENLKALINVINKCYEKESCKEELVKGEDLITNFEGNLGNYKQEITEKLSFIINLTRYISEKQTKAGSIKEILQKNIELFFDEYKQSNVWDEDIFNMVIDDIQLKIEATLIKRLENDIPNFEEKFGVIEKTCRSLQNEIDLISNVLLEIKQNFEEIRNKEAKKLENEDFVRIINSLEKVILSFKNISAEVKKKFAFIRETQQQYLREIRNEINLLENDFSTQISNFKVRISELLHELEQIQVAEEKAKEVQPEEISSDEVLLNKLSALMDKRKGSFVSVNTVTNELEISDKELQDLAKKNGYRITKTRIYKNKGKKK